MLRLSRLTDYAAVVLCELSRHSGRQLSAQALSKRVALNEATVAKILKLLTRAGIIDSQRGQSGGYSFIKSADQVSLRDVIAAVEGPIALTACVEFGEGCDMQDACRVFGRWETVNQAINQTLDSIMMSTLIDDFTPVPDFIYAYEGGNPVEGGNPAPYNIETTPLKKKEKILL